MNTNEEIFESSIRPDEDLAGVYEQDADGAYFYLYDLTKPEGEKVVSAIQIHAGSVQVMSDTIKIEWDESGTAVGLFIDGSLIAAFSDSGKKWRAESEEQHSEIPQWLRRAFPMRRSH